MSDAAYKYGRPGTKGARLREVVHEHLLAQDAAGDIARGRDVK